MLGGADDDSVVLRRLELVVEPAVVAEALGAGGLAESASEGLGVDVTDRYHLLAEDGVEVAAATAAATDDRHPQLFRPVFGADDCGQAEDRAGGNRRAEERPPARAAGVGGGADRDGGKLGGTGFGAHGGAPAGKRGLRGA